MKKTRIGLLSALLVTAMAAGVGCAAEEEVLPTDTLPTVESGEEWIAERNFGAGLFKRGLTYSLNGEQYSLDGSLEDGKRDAPGHSWVKLGGGWTLGRHANTGPFGLSQWWSSDADDGELLYYVLGKIDTWSESKANWYKARGFVHYHKFVTDDRTPHPSKVMFQKRIAVSSFNLDRGPKSWLAHEVTPGVDRKYTPNTKYQYPAREEFLYVGCADKGGLDPDFLAVIGADPSDPATYSQITHRTDLPGIGDEVHHYGTNVFKTKVLVPGLFSGRTHLINIEDNPREPFVESYHDNLIPDSNYTVPHTVIGMPDGGYVMSMIGANTPSTGPGGLVKLDADGEFVAPFGPPAIRTPEDAPPSYMYDVGFNRIRNKMITTTFGRVADVAGGITIEGLGNEVAVWDIDTQTVTQTVDLGPGTGALEVRWLSEMGSTIGFTNTPGTSEIWRWEDEDLDGHYDFQPAISLPPFSIPVDILLSSDDKYLYVSNWVGNNVMQYDVSDPFNPVFVSQVTIPNSQMMRISPDNKRIYVSNSLLSTWDDTEFPAGVTRNTNYGVFMINIDHEIGRAHV